MWRKKYFWQCAKNDFFSKFEQIFKVIIVVSTSFVEGTTPAPIDFKYQKHEVVFEFLNIENEVSCKCFLWVQQYIQYLKIKNHNFEQTHNSLKICSWEL